eukprot:TRINITY_DN18758_c0_g1_i1.p1 TRINITY_DN18758_c0_g1~~TRINITY_DN18758_c0_g1_i1.p1  ORF type:complete len:249 (+),score=57.34 TRINITY_DN18758_c0_g1_i1:278-1024(+)
MAEGPTLATVCREVKQSLEGEFTWALTFRPSFVASLSYEGFLCICSDLGGTAQPGLWVLLPKMHEQRAVIYPLQAPPRPSKSNRKRARDFQFSVGRDFDAVVEGCIEQHGENWLYPPMRHIFQVLREQHQQLPAPLNGIRLLCFEVWKDGELAAGEIGAAIGGVYTSYTGFYRVSGAGKAQLAGTHQWLEERGIRMWDLGQMMEYKLEVGATAMPRAQFVSLFEQLRTEQLQPEISSVIPTELGSLSL